VRTPKEFTESEFLSFSPCAFAQAAGERAQAEGSKVAFLVYPLRLPYPPFEVVAGLLNEGQLPLQMCIH
jgi:hypothetical protein